MNDFTDISCNPSGTHALQSLIEIINMPGEEELVKEAVKDYILPLSYVNSINILGCKWHSCHSESNYLHFRGQQRIYKLYSFEQYTQISF